MKIRWFSKSDDEKRDDKALEELVISILRAEGKFLTEEILEFEIKWGIKDLVMKRIRKMKSDKIIRTASGDFGLKEWIRE